MEKRVPSTRRSFMSIAKKAAVIFVISVVCIVAIVILLFSIYKDEIAVKLQTEINKNINGEISFSDVSLTPFKHFPNIAVELIDLKLKRKADTTISSPDIPLFEFRNVYLSFNLIDLISSKINIPRVSIESGYLNLIIFQDSSSNFGKTLKREVKATPAPGVNKTQKPSSKEKPAEMDLTIDELNISNVRIIAQNYLTNNKLITVFNDLNTNLEYNSKNIAAEFYLNSLIDTLVLNGKIIISNQPLHIDSRIKIDPEKEFINIGESELALGEAYFAFAGFYDIKNQGDINLSIKGSGINSSIISFILSDSVKKRIRKGTADFNVLLKGKTYTEMPLIEAQFNLADIAIINSITNKPVKNINLKGSFNSGIKSDFSEARLVVDTLYADFVRGSLRFKGKFKNFVSPQLDITLLADADVTELDQVFDLQGIDSLKGRVKINERFKGRYYRESKKLVTESNNLKIDLQNFGVIIPGAISVDKVNGSIIRKNDNYFLNDLSINYKDTDLLINGELTNLQYLIFGIEKDIAADLKITAPVFNPGKFLSFDPSIQRDFPYRILDLNLKVKAVTTTKKALEFKSFPEIRFEINKFDATLEKFLPRIKIKSGIFTISENLLGFNLKCEKFETDFLDGQFNFNAEYNTSAHQRYYIKLKADLTNVVPAILYDPEMETAHDTLKERLTGSFFTDFKFTDDSLQFKFFNLRDGNLKYTLKGDTIIAKNLNFAFENIYFNDEKNPNPLATLSTSGELKAELFTSSRFKFNDIKIGLNVSNGKYEIASNQARFFGRNARGNSLITLEPFTKLPSYNIKFNVTRFFAEEMLAVYMEDQILSGPLNLFMDINLKGTDWSNMVENLNGSIKLEGHNLILKGMDADKFIDNFKRSQNFNLIDIGGVLLAGPVGLVLTKGTDYARLIILNSGESSEIIDLASNWTISKGKFVIQDAAFTTRNNRIALKGSVNIPKDSLNLSIALLNEYGCSDFLQQLYGKIDEPTMGKVKVFSTLAAPVVNLYENVFSIDCDQFYKGKVPHPLKKAK